MPAAVVMERLMNVPVETLVRAFSNVKSLTALDANILARDANGVIASQISFDDARVVASQLTTIGIPCRVVDQDYIPVLANPIVSRRVKLHDDRIELQDALGRPLFYPAENLSLVCAGAVMLKEQVREKVQQPYRALNQRFHGRHGQFREPPKTYTRTREETKRHLVCDIFFNREPWRFRLLDGACPGVVEGLSMTDSQRDTAFAAWIRQLVEFAPKAMRNQGVKSCMDGEGEVFAYASRQSFEEECRWWHWHVNAQ